MSHADAKFDVLTALLLKIQAFWDVTLLSLDEWFPKQSHPRRLGSSSYSDTEHASSISWEKRRWRKHIRLKY
jgi:hypothetical protein